MDGWKGGELGTASVVALVDERRQSVQSLELWIDDEPALGRKQQAEYVSPAIRGGQDERAMQILLLIECWKTHGMADAARRVWLVVVAAVALPGNRISLDSVAQFVRVDSALRAPVKGIVLARRHPTQASSQTPNARDTCTSHSILKSHQRYSKISSKDLAHYENGWKAVYRETNCSFQCCFSFLRD